jgi:hypothetical protein
MKTCLLVVALLPAAAPAANAQRVIDTRKAFERPEDPRPSYPSASVGHKSRTTFALQRVFFGATIGVAVGFPLFYYSGVSESSPMLVVAGAAYILATAAGAPLVESDACSGDRRFFRALGGSFLGGLVGGGIAGAINGRKDLAAIATAVFAFLGPPVGAAALLTPCD